MAPERLATRAKELEEGLLYSDRLALDTSDVLRSLIGRLTEFSDATSTIRTRAHALTIASQNVRQVRERSDELLASLDTSRRVRYSISRGPGGNQLDAFLAAVDELDASIELLSQHASMSSVPAALMHAKQIQKEAMQACAADFASTLSAHSRLDVAAQAQRGEPICLVNETAVNRLQVLANTMIKGGYRGFKQVYVELRSDAFDRMFYEVGTRDMSQVGERSAAEQVEARVQVWTKAVGILDAVLREDRRLAQAVFDGMESCEVFTQTIEKTVVAVVQHGREIVNSRYQSHDKMFFLLDMHQLFERVLASLKSVLCDGEGQKKMFSDLVTLKHQTAREARNILTQFGESVAGDPGRKELPDGTVHPLTANTLGFLKRLLKHKSFPRVLYGDSDASDVGEDAEASQYQLGNQMSMRVMHILMGLVENLETKAQVYKNKALSAIFSMNNIRFIITSMELSNAISLLGEEWVRRQEALVQGYAQQYHQIAWKPVIRALAVGNIEGGEHKRKAAVKERFRTFNDIMADVHETQSEWSVPDPDLKASIKKAILDDLVPAFQEFMVSFQSFAYNMTKNPEKYFKYTAEKLIHIVNKDFFESRVLSHSKDAKKSKLDAL
ncbi:unnamed protein product [Ostreobium quekettii]|uniref:Exocyst subunit Exo70 family protein n=1 Tax=Ostreobium quekettii TaxID=121088 RepID=A0A8S1J367_9CHLO|nr:unnamed protein product [Ostreobium quekettii]